MKQISGYEFGVGGAFMLFTAYRWAATIVQEGGQKPSQQMGTVLAMTLGFLAALLLVDFGLWRLRLNRPVRGGLWGAAALGPYAGLLAWEAFGHPVWGHVIGLGSTILFFALFYLMEQRLKPGAG